jgi:hypothetical protein
LANQKRVSKVIVVTAFVFPLVVLSFQNCSQVAPCRTTRALSALEVQKAIQSPSVQNLLQSLPSSELNTICSEASNYLCVINSFSPENSYEHSFSHYCVNDRCYPLEVWSYDSSEALKQCLDCAPEEGRIGGRYNYDEIYCFNRSLTQLTSVEDLQFGDSLDEAIASAQVACHNVVSQ